MTRTFKCLEDVVTGMRDEDDIGVAVQAMENRLEEAENQFNVAFNAPKRDALTAVLDGTDPEAIIEQMDNNLREPDLSFKEFIVTMATKNAASWVLGDLDSI